MSSDYTLVDFSNHDSRIMGDISSCVYTWYMIDLLKFQAPGSPIFSVNIVWLMMSGVTPLGLKDIVTQYVGPIS